MAPLMLPIEIFSHLVRFVSLTIRLTANMFADHTLRGDLHSSFGGRDLGLRPLDRCSASASSSASSRRSSSPSSPCCTSGWVSRKLTRKGVAMRAIAYVRSRPWRPSARCCRTWPSRPRKAAGGGAAGIGDRLGSRHRPGDARRGHRTGPDRGRTRCRASRAIRARRARSRAPMIIGLALIESIALFAFVIAFLIQGKI